MKLIGAEPLIFLVDKVDAFCLMAKPLLLNLLTYPRLKARQLLGEFSRAICRDAN